MTDTTTANAYLRTRVMTASPEELRLLLLEGALRFATQAREGLEKKDAEGAFSGFTQCRAIIMELINTIRPEHDPELAERVRSLYMYLYAELVAASTDKDIPRLDKAIALLEYERETWVLLMGQLADERKNNGPIPMPEPSDAEAAPKSISLQA